jgi:tetratricopeptide (TPR) repeat protein
MLQHEIGEQLRPVPSGGKRGTRILVIYGLGGSGKSQLALNFVHTCREYYTSIFWIDAGQKETLERDYLSIYRLLFSRLSAGSELPTVSEAVTMVKSWFHGQSGRSLLIFDNAHTIDNPYDISYIDLNYFLPDAPCVDAIITTRSSRAQEMTALKAVKVAGMEEAEAAELFRTSAKLAKTGLEVEKEIILIIHELGYLALAIALAGSYIAATPRLRLNIRSYLPEYRERRKQLLGIKGSMLIHRYGESVLSTWETSFAVIERQSTMAARLLSLLAFLNFDDIFPALFERSTDRTKLIGGTSEASDRRWQVYLLPDSPLDPYAIQGAFEILRTYSLIQWRDEQGGYAIHKLVHAWSQDRLEVEQQRHLSLMALELLTDIIPSTVGNPIFGIRLVPHVMANFAVVSAITAASATIRGDVLNDILDSVTIVGDFLRDLGRWSDEYEVRAFHFREICKLAGTEHPSTLTSMNNLAEVLSRQGKHKQAEEIHRQALGLYEAILGKMHPSTLTSMNNLAEALRSQGKYDQAEELHRQTLKLGEMILGPEHPSTLASMSNLAEVLSNQGKDEQAEEMHRKVLRLREMILGEEHPSTLTSMSNLADALSIQGKDEQAEEMHRQVLRLREKVLGKEHPSTLMSMSNLAVVLTRQESYEQAEEMHRHVLRLRGMALGKEHPHTLMSMNNLASLLSGQGRYEQAEEMHRQALRLRETVLGKQHPSTLTSMSNLANVLSDQGKYEQAEEMHRQVSRLSETVLGKEHPDTLASMNNLALVIDDSDVASIRSIGSFSGSDASTLANPAILAAADEFVDLLLQDEILSPLFPVAFGRISAAKLERNLGRLLKQYALDLKAEASDALEGEAIRLVQSRARYIAGRIRWRFDATQRDHHAGVDQLQGQATTGKQILERYLLDRKMAEPGAVNGQSIDLQDGKMPDVGGLNESNLDLGDNDSNEGDLDPPSDSEQDGLYNLNQVKAFMIQSMAFSKLRNDLRLFIFPDLKDPIAKLKDERITRSSITSWERLRAKVSEFSFIIRLLFRPSLSPGYLRITWICVSSITPLREIPYAIVEGCC